MIKLQPDISPELNSARRVLYLHIDAFVVRVYRQPGDVGFVIKACIHVTTPLHWRPLRIPTGTLQ